MENSELMQQAQYVKELETIATGRTEQVRSALVTVQTLVSALKRVQEAQGLEAARIIAAEALTSVPQVYGGTQA